MKRKVAALCLAMTMVMSCGISSSMASGIAVIPTVVKTLQEDTEDAKYKQPKADDPEEENGEVNRKHLAEVSEWSLKIKICPGI